MERRLWTEEQDLVLQQTVQRQGPLHWNRIAQLIASHLQYFSRNGKQCRERWFNHLQGKIIKGVWSSDQQTKFLQLYQKHLNRWSQITKNLPGRSQNSVKNFFYSTLRRSTRKINKSLSDQRQCSTSIRKLKSCQVKKITKLSNLESQQGRFAKSLLIDMIILGLNSQCPLQSIKIESIIEKIRQLCCRKSQKKQQAERSEEESQEQVEIEQELEKVVQDKIQNQSNQEELMDKKNKGISRLSSLRTKGTVQSQFQPSTDNFLSSFSQHIIARSFGRANSFPRQFMPGIGVGQPGGIWQVPVVLVESCSKQEKEVKGKTE